MGVQARDIVSDLCSIELKGGERRESGEAQGTTQGRVVISDKLDDFGTLFLARPLRVYELSSSAAFA